MASVDKTPIPPLYSVPPQTAVNSPLACGLLTFRARPFNELSIPFSLSNLIGPRYTRRFVSLFYEGPRHADNFFDDSIEGHGGSAGLQLETLLNPLKASLIGCEPYPFSHPQRFSSLVFASTVSTSLTELLCYSIIM